jgi:beta-1,4-mannosyltransferase
LTDWTLHPCNSGRKATFHDRPQETSHRLSAGSAHELFKKLDNVFTPIYQENFLPRPSSSETIFSTASKAVNGIPGPAWRKDRPALLISSTSWTADEDFSLLLDAARQYEAQARQNAKLPKLVVVITGKGGMKAAFEESVKELEKEWKKVRILTAWLEAGDYPKLLGELIILESRN